MPLSDDLARQLSNAESQALVGELFGPEGAAEGARRIIDLACRHGDPVAVCLVRVGSGIVVGFETADTARFVVKVHRRHVVPRLPAVQAAQAALFAAGLPVPRPLAEDAVALGTGAATVESWLDDGDTIDVRPAERRRSIARAAHQIGAALEGHSTDGLEPTWTGRYPPPHSPVFDFEATSAGAEWIDELADHALGIKHDAEHRRIGRTAVLHSDLRPENVRLRDTPAGPSVSSIYDLDSLIADFEPWLVGGIARAFSTNWSQADPMLPTVGEIRAFIDDYEAERGTRFTADERTLAEAGVLHALAYSARCEHALFPNGEDAPWGPGWRALLKAWAARST